MLPNSPILTAKVIDISVTGARIRITKKYYSLLENNPILSSCFLTHPGKESIPCELQTCHTYAEADSKHSTIGCKMLLSKSYQVILQHIVANLQRKLHPISVL